MLRLVLQIPVVRVAGVHGVVGLRFASSCKNAACSTVQTPKTVLQNIGPKSTNTKAPTPKITQKTKPKAEESKPTKPVQITKDQEKEIRKELTESIRDKLRVGFDSKEDIIEESLSSVDTSDDENVKKWAEAIYQTEEGEYKKKMKSWPKLTDNARMHRAFASLEKVGIICRENWWCCGSCGSGAIRDEMKQLREKGNNVIGYLFYHQQDAEAAASTSTLYFNYGAYPIENKENEQSSTDENVESTDTKTKTKKSKLTAEGKKNAKEQEAQMEMRAVGVGMIAANDLVEQGLDVVWDYDIKKRIMMNLKWQNNKPYQPSTHPGQELPAGFDPISIYMEAQEEALKMEEEAEEEGEEAKQPKKSETKKAKKEDSETTQEESVKTKKDKSKAESKKAKKEEKKEEKKEKKEEKKKVKKEEKKDEKQEEKKEEKKEEPKKTKANKK